MSRQVPRFYMNKQVEQFAAKRSTPISLKHLINYGKQSRIKGLEEEGSKLLRGGNFLRTELPTRISHRLRDLQSLPFIVTSHTHFENVYNLYLEAFDSIRNFPPLKTLEDNDRFCEFLQTKLTAHDSVISELALGVLETSPAHLPPMDLDRFMTRMLRSRFSRRLISEQHIALTQQFRRRQAGGHPDDREVGIIDTQLSAADVLHNCQRLIASTGRPEREVPIVVEGATDARFAYIPHHLEFMLFELLKFATYATVAAHGPERARDFPVRITLVDGTRDLQVRVSDRAGGLPPYGGLPEEEAPPLLHPGLRRGVVSTSERIDIFSFANMRRQYQARRTAATAGELARGVRSLQQQNSLLQRSRDASDLDLASDSGRTRSSNDFMLSQVETGIGLPLARMYAEYFSGSLSMHTVLGYGSDALLRVVKFGTVQNNDDMM